MAEKIDLAAPDQSRPGTSEYRIAGLFLNVEDEYIEINLRGANAELRVERYADALDLIIALNKANLSTKSLQRRIMERLIADGRLAGSISGTPD
jgi:hypothetical protein